MEVPDRFAVERQYAPPPGAFFVVRHAGALVGSVGVKRLDGGTDERTPAGDVNHTREYRFERPV